MSNVYFAKSPELAFGKKLKQELSKILKPNDKVAVKLHLGEPGNKYFLKPEFTKKIINILKGLKTKPFLFDSPVSYTSPRATAEGYKEAVAKHGYNENNIGCPVVISDGFVPVKLPEFKNFVFEVCTPLTEADFVLVLSHVKGHYCSGFGGAIKNLGMGAMSKNTKHSIHDGGHPEFVGGCILCGNCVAACPLENVRLDKNKKQPFFDKSWCCGCSNCSYACESDAIKPKINYFDRLLAGAAKAALQKFKNQYFVNVIVDVAKHCDCEKHAGPIIAKDVGVLSSKDIVAIEKASLDLVIKQEGNDPFLAANKKSPLVHIKEAEKLGVGNSSYKLINL